MMMKTNLRYCVLLLLCILTATLSAQQYKQMMHDGKSSFRAIQKAAYSHFDTIGTGKGTGFKQFKRWEYFARRNLTPTGTVRSTTKSYYKARDFKKSKSNTNKSNGILGNWQELGPKNAVKTSTWSSHLGRISAIAVDDKNPNHIIVGSPSGGVWKTTNEGHTWTPIFDTQAMINVYSLHINTQNSAIYLAGTSGLGIMRSTDGGATWQATYGDISNDDKIIDIKSDPNNHNILLAIHQFGKLYRSTDGGLHWNLVMDTEEYLYDVEFKLGNTNVVYLSGEGQVWISRDNGQYFTAMQNGSWTQQFNHPIMLAVTPDDPDFIYALQANWQGGLHGIHRSTNGGVTWQMMTSNTSGNLNLLGYRLVSYNGQAPRDMDIVAATDNKYEIHVGGIMSYRSQNSGVHWSQTSHWVTYHYLPFIHADVDIMVYKNGKLYVGTDGGFFISENHGNSFIDRSTGLGVRQFYRIGVSATQKDFVSGGSQDNGTGVLKNGTWYDFIGADGMETFVDWSNSDNILATIQFGDIYASSDAGQSYSSLPRAGSRGNWVTPLEQDPEIPNRVYVAKDAIYVSNNLGQSWSALTNTFGLGNADEMKISPVDNDLQFISFDDRLYRTSNGGQTWDEITPQVSFNNITYIAVHHCDADKIAITLSGSNAKILKSDDRGNTWYDISSDLPDIGINTAVFTPDKSGALFVGMSPGVYYSSGHPSSSWQILQNTLPMVSVTELEFQHNTLYAATYGRGLWKADYVQETQSFLADDIILNNPTVYASENKTVNAGRDIKSNDKIITKQSSTIRWRAQRSIEVNNEFEVEKGSEFFFEILGNNEDCPIIR